MSRKRPKQLLSLVLGALMMVTMIPIGAIAAENPTNDQTASTGEKGTITISLTAAKKFESGVIKSTKAYNSLGVDEVPGVSRASDEEAAKKNVAALSAVYTGGEKALTVDKGDTFYVGAKVTLDEANKGEYKGIIRSMVAVKYDPTKLEYLGASVATPAAANKVLTNGAYISGAADGLEAYKATSVSLVNQPAQTIDSNVAIVQVGGNNNGEYYLPQVAPWDYVFPFKAISGTGENAPATIEVYTDYYKGDLTGLVRVGGVENDGSVTMSNPTGGSTGNGTGVAELTVDASKKDYISTSNVAVTIKSTDPAMTVADASKKIGVTTTNVTSRKINVTFANATLKTGVDNNGWTITGASNSSAAVSSVERGTDGKSAVVTVTNVPIADEDLTLTAPTTAFDGIVDTSLTATIGTVAVPTGVRLNYSNIKLTSVDNTMSYKIGNADWTDIQGAETEAALNEANLVAAANNTTDSAQDTTPVSVVLSANKNYADAAELITVKQAAKPTVEPTVDYEYETVNAPDTVSFTIGTTATVYTGTGSGGASGADIKAGIPLSTAGADLPIHYYTKSDDSTYIRSLAVDSTTNVIKRRPALTIAAAEDPDAKRDGNTKLTVTKTPTDATVKYWVGVSGDTSVPGAGTSAGDLMELGSDSIAKFATEGKYIHGFIPAVASTSFKSDLAAQVEGTGNTVGTVQFTGIANGSKKISLKLYNETWNWSGDDLANPITVKHKGTAPSATLEDMNGLAIAKDDTDPTTVLHITKTDDSAFAAGEYEISQVENATTGGASKHMLVDASNTTEAIRTDADNGTYKFTISDKGYKIKLDTDGVDRTDTNPDLNASSALVLPTTTFGASAAEANPAEVAITGLKGYEKITGITKVSGSGTVTINANGDGLLYKAPTELPGTEDGIEDVVIQLTISKRERSIAISDLELTGGSAQKTYDGNADGAAPAALKVKIKVDSLTNLGADDYDELGLTATDVEGTLKFVAHGTDDAAVDVGTGYDLNAYGLTVKDTSSAGGYYTIAAEKGTIVENTAEIQAAAMSKADGAVTLTANAADIDAAAKAISGAVLTPYVNISSKDVSYPNIEGTVGDLLKNSDLSDVKTQIQAAVDAAKIGAEISTADHAYSITTDATEDSETVNANDTLTINLDSGITTVDHFILQDGTGSEYAGGDLVLDDDTAGIVRINKDLAADGRPVTLNFKVVGVDESDTAVVTVTFTNMTVNQAAYTYDISGMADNDSITVDLPASVFTAAPVNYSAYNNVKVVLTYKKPSVTPPAPSGFGVSFDAKGYGTPESSYIETDADGKITELPKVGNVVKGAVFLGWSTDGTKAHIIDPETYMVKEDIKLVAVFEGYMSGYGNGKVEPKEQVTRAELLKMLLVSAGLYDSSKDYGKPSFNDAKNHWAANYIACAEQSGKTIVEGYPDNTFRPNQPVTRQEAAKMIANTFGVTVEEDATTDKITDFDSVQDWAKKYVAALCENGTIDGFEDGTFRAKANIQRDQASKMANIYLGLEDADKETIKSDSDIKSPFTDMTNKDNWAYADIMFASLSVPASFYSTDIVVPGTK